jgi:outer membrane protein OmpA-like peptidoglycan-associated protein
MRIRVLCCLPAAALCAAAALAQGGGDPDGGPSRAMKTAIMFYERGDDMQAMDRFMDILVKGEPSERAMANEYLNLITHRMNVGTKDFKRPSPPPATQLEAVEKTPTPGPAARTPDADGAAVEYAPAPAAPAAPLRTAVRSDAPMPSANRDLMRKEIRAKLRHLLETSLRELKSYEGVRVPMQENGDPQAVGIPSSLLFTSGISFNKDAGRLLESLTRLAYSLGSTQIVILPEGAGVGDAKVLDMRRSMGVSAHLFTAGIATPRVRVNLLSSQVVIPKTLKDFKGIVLVFIYNRPLELVVESSLGEEAGPPISLGVYPQAIRPEDNEGAVIEFSVSDPPAGLVSWRFQLLQPSADGTELAPLQEVTSGGPAFHQIYWNGRQNYFGAVLPGGRYECILTATDAKSRTRTLHRWIQLLAPEAAAPLAAAPRQPAAPAKDPAAPAAAAPAAKPAPSKPVVELPGQGESILAEERAPMRAVQIKKPPRAARKAPKRGRPGARTTAKAKAPPKPAPKPEAEPAVEAAPPAAEAAPKKEKAAAVPGLSVIPFKADTHQMTPEGEKVLAKVADAAAGDLKMEADLLGFAAAGEPDAARLAERRAQMIAGLLINKYQLEPKRIQVRSEVSEAGEARKVEVRLTGKELR